MKQKCTMCGVCCRIFQINLNKSEYESGIYRTQLEKYKFEGSFKQAEKCGATIVKQNKDGSCIYLINNSCSIHKTRPSVCRPFFSTSKAKKYQGMIKEINKVKSAER